MAFTLIFGASIGNAGPCSDLDPVNATEEEIECAIQKGLDYLIPFQASGYWFDGYTTVAGTGLICAKLIDRAKELGVDPFSEAYEYSSNLVAAINYLAVNLQSAMGGLVQLHGDETTYATGICTMCFADAASVDPDRTAMVGGSSLTYQEITKALVDWLVAAQNTTSCAQGGWYYTGSPAVEWADNSISGYATLGLGFASTLAGINISATLSPLDTFIDNIQQSGGIYDGGSKYEACFFRGIGINTLKTGNLLYELGMVWDAPGDVGVDRAMDFIANYWANLGGDGDGSGWRGDYQAMFTMMKGLEGLAISTLPGDIDWFNEVATYIVENQYVDGHWYHTASRGTNVLDTVWAMLTLEKAVPTLVKRVPFDIKPGSCPNPINVKSKGVIPAAIMGTDNFDVTTIDPATLVLRLKDAADGGVSPLRWALADVGAPFEPFIGKEDCYEDCDGCSCADGKLDLVFHFDTQEVVAALGDVNDEDCLVLEIIGALKEENGGTPIVGEDVVRILVKGKQK